MKTLTHLSPVVAALALATLPAAPLAAQTPSQQAEVLYRQGLSAEKAGDPEAARTAYVSALKAHPQHPHARFRLGQLKLEGPEIAAKGREAKFGSVMVPQFRLEEATFREALDALQGVVEKQSKGAVSPNFVIRDPNGSLAEAKISLVLKNVPAREVLRYVLETVGARARYDEHAIVIEKT